MYYISMKPLNPIINYHALQSRVTVHFMNLLNLVIGEAEEVWSLYFIRDYLYRMIYWKMCF